MGTITVYSSWKSKQERTKEKLIKDLYAVRTLERCEECSQNALSVDLFDYISPLYVSLLWHFYQLIIFNSKLDSWLLQCVNEPPLSSLYWYVTEDNLLRFIDKYNIKMSTLQWFSLLLMASQSLCLISKDKDLETKNRCTQNSFNRQTNWKASSISWRWCSNVNRDRFSLARSQSRYKSDFKKLNQYETILSFVTLNMESNYSKILF